MKIDELNAYSKAREELRNELIKIKDREKKLREQYDNQILRNFLPLPFSISRFVSGLFPLVNPCAEIPLREDLDAAYRLVQLYREPIISGPVIHIPTKCKTCNGSKKVLLLYSYVDCVDC